MPIENKKLILNTNGFTDIIDITPNITTCIQNTTIKNGIVSIYVEGSTASIISIEYEPGLIKDLKEIFDKLIPQNVEYQHNKTWQDGNGHSHIRSALLGNSIQIPLINGFLQLGTWQQIVLIDFDNKPRSRNVTIQIIY